MQAARFTEATRGGPGGRWLIARRLRRLRQLRRLDILFGTAWRAAPLLATECVLAALGSSLLLLAYPLGFRAIVDGAIEHRRAGS